MNGHVPNGQGVGEMQELQELLPAPRPVEPNPECDSKGGVNGVQPRCSRILRQGVNLNLHSFGLDSQMQNGFLPQAVPPPTTEDLVIVVRNGDVCRGDGGTIEISSDLSHSPAATASSLHSWNQEDRVAHHTSAISMPNLADSGIGFDDNSSRLEKGQCGLCGGKNGVYQKNGGPPHLRRGTAI